MIKKVLFLFIFLTSGKIFGASISYTIFYHGNDFIVYSIENDSSKSFYDVKINEGVSQKIWIKPKSFYTFKLGYSGFKEGEKFTIKFDFKGDFPIFVNQSLFGIFPVVNRKAVLNKKEETQISFSDSTYFSIYTYWGMDKYYTDCKKFVSIDKLPADTYYLVYNNSEVIQFVIAWKGKKKIVKYKS